MAEEPGGFGPVSEIGSSVLGLEERDVVGHAERGKGEKKRRKRAGGGGEGEK